LDSKRDEIISEKRSGFASYRKKVPKEKKKKRWLK